MAVETEPQHKRRKRKATKGYQRLTVTFRSQSRQHCWSMHVLHFLGWIYPHHTALLTIITGC